MNIIYAYKSENEQAHLITNGLLASGQRVVFCNLDSQPLNLTTEDIFTANIVHFNNAPLVASRISDMIKLAYSHLVTLLQYDTSEVRTRTEAVRFNPYANLDPAINDDVVRNRLQLLSQYFPACIVKTAEAAVYASKYHSRVYIVPYAIDLEVINHVASFPASSNTLPLIVHPSTNESKGTEFVETVIDRLRNAGYRFNYERIDNSDRANTLYKIQQADIIIDQLLHGTYGIVSIEAMALGKPVISHVREDIKTTFDSSLPVISANPATLYHHLASLLEDADLRKKAGKAGREFVEKHHQTSVVINKLMAVYDAEIAHLNLNHSG